MGRDVKDINPFWHILCAVLVMACYSDEEPSKSAPMQRALIAQWAGFWPRLGDWLSRRSQRW